MSKFKVGDKIVPIGGRWSCNEAKNRRADYAVITGFSPNCRYEYGLYRGSERVGNCWFCQGDTNSKLMEKTMENLEKGDVLVNEVGAERTVIETLGDLVFTTGSRNDYEYVDIFNNSSLKSEGYTVKGADQTTELTMDEIAKLAGVDVKNLKIKKED